MLSSEGLTATYVVDSLVSLVPMGRGDGYHKMDVPVSVCVCACVCVFVCAHARMCTMMKFLHAHA